MDVPTHPVPVRAGAAIALLAGVLVVATPAASSTRGPLSRSASAAVQGGTLTMARATDIFNFDPQNAPDQEAISTVLEIYDRVVQFAPHSARIRPGLATSWKFIAPNTWRFHLRRGVRFQNGTPFDASAV